jgi:hypothetical protein|uniref:Cobalamin biosynthesis protein CobQ n=1 Tax=Mesoaciditoga lauensis TaxID=1495039 RepID=A0A7V3REH3_9BACT
MFGSGKTEISLNTALNLKRDVEHVALIDIDVISPYFRSRDEKSYLEKTGIKMVTAPDAYIHADLPIIAAEVGGYLSNEEYFTVADVGGNEDGAIVLGSLKNFLDKSKKSVFFVINVFRPFSSNEDEIISNILRISQSARVKIDYLINNSNIGSETGAEEIENGEEIVKAVSIRTGIPVAFTAISNDIDYSGTFPVFKMVKFMKNPW